MHTITLTDEQWKDLHAVFTSELEVGRDYFKELEDMAYWTPEDIVAQRAQEKRIDALRVYLFGLGESK